jgi:HAD superfamily hydrolase (TIGR01509 family)
MSEMSGLSAMLWDVDGTLIDTTAIIVGALGRVFKEFLGRDVPGSELRAMIGIPVDDQMRIFGDPSEIGVDVADMEAAAIHYYEQQRSQEHPIPEALDALIEARRRGIKTALVTSKNDVELAHTLPRLGISAYCDAIIGADQVAPDYKPHPRGVQLALEKLGVRNPADAMFIGDSVYDVRAGRAAGVLVAAVLWGAAPADMLRAERPDFIFEQPGDLLSFVRDLRQSAVPR